MSETAGEPPVCPVCGHLSWPDRLVCRSSAGVKYSYSRCSGCGLHWLDPLPAAAEIGSFYDLPYYGTGDQKFPPALDGIRNLFLRRRARFVAANSSHRPGRLLDVGCGDGRFLGHMKRLGFEIYGTELPGPAFERAKKTPGIQLFPGPLIQGLFAPALFDVITIWHVLEHILEPGALLAECRRLMKADGFLVVEVPNMDCWQNRLGGSAAFNLDPPRHLYQFGVRAVTELLEKAGYSIVSRRTGSLEMGPLGAIQTLLNGFVRPRDLLYDVLRSRGKCPGSRAAKWVSIVVGLLLLPLGVLFALAETVVGKGPVIRLVCRLKNAP